MIDSVVGYWHGWDRASGYSLLDRSGSGNHGTLTNMDAATDWVGSTVRGRSGYVLDFDGVNDYVDLGSIQQRFVSNFTIGVWVLIKTLPGNNSARIILGWGSSDIGSSGIVLKINNSSGVVKYIVQKNGTGVLTSTSTPVANEWSHIAVSVLGSANRLFVNGLLENSTTSGTTPGTTGNISFGSRLGSSPMTGLGAEAWICNRQSTPPEIQQIYQLGPGRALDTFRRTRSYFAQVTAFKHWYARRQTQIIGGGL